MSSAIHSNTKLSRANFFVSTADYLVFFSALSVLISLNKNIFLAAYSVSIKSIGVALGAAVFPYLGSKFNPKKVLILTVIAISILLGFMTFIIGNEVSTNSIYFVLFIHSVLGQIFIGIRESLSKSYGSISEQRGLQSQILSSFYTSQIMGPILGFFIGFYGFAVLGMLLAIALNSISIAFIIKLPESELFPDSQIFRPLSYLKLGMPLTQIFALRSVLQWIPISLYNFLIFPVIEKQYNLTGLYAAWIFVAVAIGSTFVSFIFNPKVSRTTTALGFLQDYLRSLPDYRLAFFAMLAMALVRLLLLHIPSIEIFFLIAMFGGVASSLNAIATQTIRRKLCDPRQHPEIVGLEVIVGRFVDWLVGSICAYLLLRGHIKYDYGIVFSGIFLVTISFIVLGRKFRNI